MHELAITENLLDIALSEAERNGLKTVNSIQVVVGKMHHLVPELLQFAFDTAKENTIADHARLDIEWIPAQLQCRHCDHLFELTEWVFICPACGNFHLEQITGKELYIKSIEGE